MVVHVDNVGAIFLAENVNMSQCMKHIDIHYYYIREYVEDSFIRINS